MDLKEDLAPDDERIPRARICIMTSDTTNVMPATARELAEKYPLCESMLWVPCTSHILNLYLVDQLQITSFKLLLQHAKQIVLVLRSGVFHKMWLKHALDAKSRLQLPVKTRWCSYSDMLKSLLKHQRVVRSVVLSEEYVDAAVKAKRSGIRAEVRAYHSQQCFALMPIWREAWAQSAKLQLVGLLRAAFS